MNYDAVVNLYSYCKCDLSCSNCFETNPTESIECAPGVGYNSTTHLCEVCAEGQYSDKSQFRGTYNRGWTVSLYFGNNACNQCNSECATCSNYIQCLSCYDTRKQLNTTGHCNLVCQTNQVLVGYVCYNCMSLCERSVDRESCVTCVENALVINGVRTCDLGMGFIIIPAFLGTLMRYSQ